MSWVRKSFEILGSFGLACIILILLLLLTLAGTLEQQYTSLYEVQKQYFESYFVMTRWYVPLPGAYLLLSLLFVNLIVGGMLRMRWSMSRLGILVIHFGIAIMLMGGVIEFKRSHKGHMTLFEGENAAEFQSYFEWEVVITEPLDGGRSREHVVPHARFAELGKSQTALVSSEQLPFDVQLSGFLSNCQPVRSSADAMGVDGYLLEELPGREQAEADIAGLTVTVNGLPEGPQTGLLWGVQAAPWTVMADGKPWAFDLRRRTWPLPFAVYLRDFTRELHPGTQMPSKFYSDITCVQSNVSQDVQISMNEPLRRDGYILFQASWGPGNAAPGDRLFSTFAVVENPADQVPLISLIIIAVGLLVNFAPKLLKHVRVSAKAAA